VPLFDQSEIEGRLVCPGHHTLGRDALLAYRCSTCASPLVYEPPSWARIHDDCVGPWRYKDLLPAPYVSSLDLGRPIGVHRSKWLENSLKQERVWLVDPTKQGTGTFKDLEAIVTVAAMTALGVTSASVHSTGNTALAYLDAAERVGLPLAAYVPLATLHKLRGRVSTEHHPIIAVNADYGRVSAVARADARLHGRTHLAPLEWKIEGKALLAYTMAELCGDATTIVQTVAGGYGPLGYELGFARARLTGAFASASIIRDHVYRLYQPTDAAVLARAWESRADSPDYSLPSNPYEPTLQSTNPVATLPVLRQTLPAGSTFRCTPPRLVDARMAQVASYLAEAGITLDFEREKSAYIALAGLLEDAATDSLPSGGKLAVIISGATPFLIGASVPTPSNVIEDHDVLGAAGWSQ
jgi:Pyridoxal-phosphate dependent enzyme